MPTNRLREIIQHGVISPEQSLIQSVKERKFMRDIDWMLAQLELYGIETELDRPWILPHALKVALKYHLVSQVTWAEKRKDAH